jgi:CBS domain-containing protein/anti-sigma regulatory factor (Ser/Thr protein kinase)
MTAGFPLDPVTGPSRILELLYNMKVRDVMSADIKTASRHSPLRDIQILMKENSITGVPIVEGSRLVGMVSMDDIIRALEDGRIGHPAESGMSRNLIVLEDDMPLSFAISYMEKYHFGRFPVINKNRELVGIITSRDIIVHLLISINRELEQLEEQDRAPAQQGLEGSLNRKWYTHKFDFEEAGKASTEIKKIMKEKRPDTPPKLLRRIAVAGYELEMNQVVHSEGGHIEFQLDADAAVIRAEDRGPGIPDLENALTEGWSTANEWVRSLGFGAGMGLPNTRRVADEFTIESDESGTRAKAIFYLYKSGEE